MNIQQRPYAIDQLRALVSNEWIPGEQGFEIYPDAVPRFRSMVDPLRNMNAIGRDDRAPGPLLLGYIPAMRPRRHVNGWWGPGREIEYDQCKLREPVRARNRIHLLERCQEAVRGQNGFILTFEHKIVVADSQKTALEVRIHWFHQFGSPGIEID
jgi:hypothetical protein